MACNCFGDCACVLQAGALINIVGSGDAADPYLISALETTFSLTNLDGALDITPGGTYGHTPTIDLKIDPASPAAISITPDGLSVACCGTNTVEPMVVDYTTDFNITLSGLGDQTGGDWTGGLGGGERILVRNQTTASDNGIYVAAAGAWTRATDMDASAELLTGMKVYVKFGVMYAKSEWVLTSTGTLTIGVSSLSFDGIDEHANPLIRLYRSGDAARADNTGGNLGWNDPDYNRPQLAAGAVVGAWGRANGNSEIYFPETGFYLVRASVQWGTAGNPNVDVGNRQLSVLRNGVTIDTDVIEGSDQQTTQDVSAFVRCTNPGTDYITIDVLNSNSGATIGIMGGTTVTWLEIVKVG